LPHNLNISIKGINSAALLTYLEDLAISAGSACNSALARPSHVITALGFGEERGRSSLRFGLGRFTTPEEVEYAIERITVEARKFQEEFVVQPA
jgi:cysteine desulfurase